jgi:hypothetical protein
VSHWLVVSEYTVVMVNNQVCYSIDDAGDDGYVPQYDGYVPQYDNGVGDSW